tara:strand:- start:1241 stop:2131 length:891 start_codon:yes stop_codon:yes gene_type:complete
MKNTSEALDAVMVAQRKPEDSWRPHLGMSQIGHECDRYIWYTFFWYYIATHAARLLRIFRAGDTTETVTVSDLAKIPGVTVESATPEGGQFRLQCSEVPAFQGSMDAVAYGLPEHPDEWVVVEIKSSNKSRFNELKKKGVKASNRQYFDQLMMYMRESGLSRGLFISRCKDDDRLYTEWLEHDLYYTNHLVDRAKNILSQETPPPKLYDTPDFFKCKMCSAKDVCHSNAELPRNCRTCSNMTFNRNDNTWICQKHNVELDTIGQREGCEQWLPRQQQKETTQKAGYPSSGLKILMK